MTLTLKLVEIANNAVALSAATTFPIIYIYTKDGVKKVKVMETSTERNTFVSDDALRPTPDKLIGLVGGKILAPETSPSVVVSSVTYPLQMGRDFSGLILTDKTNNVFLDAKIPAPEVTITLETRTVVNPNNPPNTVSALVPVLTIPNSYLEDVTVFRNPTAYSTTPSSAFVNIGTITGSNIPGSGLTFVDAGILATGVGLTEINNKLQYYVQSANGTSQPVIVTFPDVVAPVINSFTAVKGTVDGQMVVSWNVATTDLNSILIERSINGGTSWTTVATYTGASAVTNANQNTTVTGTLAQSNIFRITASDEVPNNTIQSAPALTPFNTPPAAPTLVAQTSTTDGVASVQISFPETDIVSMIIEVSSVSNFSSIDGTLNVNTPTSGTIHNVSTSLTPSSNAFVRARLTDAETTGVNGSATVVIGDDGV